MTGGIPLQFNVGQQGALVFWDADRTLDLSRDAAKAKLLFDIPQDAIPPNFLTQDRPFVQIEIARVADALLPPGGHVDTAFRIRSVVPNDLTGFTGGIAPVILTLRYDPVACQIPADVETGLVLGRLGTNGAWQEVCGTTANVGAHEVSCAEGDLSFGIFGVIPPTSTTANDTTPPRFILTGNRAAATLSVGIAPGTTDSLLMTWGAAVDDQGIVNSGVVNYRVYVDGVFRTPTGNPSAGTGNPTLSNNVVTFLFSAAAAGVNINQTHTYHVQAVDAAGNLSALFGGLRFP